MISPWKLTVVIPKNIIDHGLENCRKSMTRPKSITRYSKCPKGGVKCRLPLVSLSHAHMVVGIAEVKFGEDSLEKGLKCGIKEVFILNP